MLIFSNLPLFLLPPAWFLLSKTVWHKISKLDKQICVQSEFFASSMTLGKMLYNTFDPQFFFFFFFKFVSRWDWATEHRWSQTWWSCCLGLPSLGLQMCTRLDTQFSSLQNQFSHANGSTALTVHWILLLFLSNVTLEGCLGSLQYYLYHLLQNAIPTHPLSHTLYFQTIRSCWHDQ